MRMYDLIEKKKRNESLDEAEVRFMVRGFTEGAIPDYQMAAMLMAICFNGMNDTEMTQLTLEMAHSGDMVDLSPIEGFKADKHSTGGVGDKTTLVAGPVVASLGVKVAKMSGRGLGHTGGTIDKLEAIPGFRTAIPISEFFDIVKKTGIAVVGQSGNLVPADKKIYALRDVTATVDSIPLIASSIMSKKLAAGKMVAIGNGAGRSCTALITDMDVPLGAAIGNSLEVIEAVETLRGNGPEDLKEVSLRLAAEMLHTAGMGDAGSCYGMAEQTLKDGRAFETFKRMVAAQGGDPSFIENPKQFLKAPYSRKVTALQDGYVGHMDTEGCGIASVLLKAGRSTKEDVIDNSAGIILHKKYGDYVQKGEPLAELFASDETLFEAAGAKLLSSYHFTESAPEKKMLVYARVSRDGTKRFD